MHCVSPPLGLAQQKIGECMQHTERMNQSPYKVHLMLLTKVCSQLLSYHHSSGLRGRGVHERLGHFSLSQK